MEVNPATVATGERSLNFCGSQSQNLASTKDDPAEDAIFIHTRQELMLCDLSMWLKNLSVKVITTNITLEHFLMLTSILAYNYDEPEIGPT